ncbi:MAG: winged helix-turn-helix domain-containing protein [Acidimicrobiia bacterium]|nr:winged helix-turn-helix domain-containing protein [Acidimicrobiia bacterium]
MGEQPRVATIASILQIEALSSQARVRVLRYADHPITVADLARRLDVPPTRLYYHVNLLVEAGLLEQVDERRSGARLEKLYRRTAAEFTLGADIVDVIGDRRKAAEAAATVLLDTARAEVEDFLEHSWGEKEEHAYLGRTLVRLTPETATTFAERLNELVDELRDLDQDDDDRSRTFSLTAAFLPTDIGKEHQ